MSLKLVYEISVSLVISVFVTWLCGLPQNWSLVGAVMSLAFRAAHPNNDQAMLVVSLTFLSGLFLHITVSPQLAWYWLPLVLVGNMAEMKLLAEKVDQPVKRN